MTATARKVIDRFLDDLDDAEAGMLLRKLRGFVRVGPFTAHEYAEISTLVAPPPRARSPEEIARLERHAAALAARETALAAWLAVGAEMQRRRRDARRLLIDYDEHGAPDLVTAGRRMTPEQRAQLEDLATREAAARELYDKAATAEVEARPHRPEKRAHGRRYPFGAFFRRTA